MSNNSEREVLCQAIRQKNKSKEKIFSMEGLLESASILALRTIEDYEHNISEIIIRLEEKKKIIEEIRAASKNSELDKRSVKIMNLLEVLELEEVGDVALKFILEPLGEMK